MTSHTSQPSQLIIGDGEVGAALAHVLDVATWDPLTALTPGGHVDVIHIAIPYVPDFTDLVDGYQHRFGADLVVVHSTVPVDTCDPNGWVHSPVHGQHPHLARALRTFVKHFGGALAPLAADLFTTTDVVTWCHDLAATTEAGKLIELARLGVEVRVEKEIVAYCAAHGLPVTEVYDEFTATYNRGYTRLHQTRFVKPLLAHMPGPLGGHCVGENTPLLDHRFFTDLVHPISREGWTGDLP